jgi:hypothetical protein
MKILVSNEKMVNNPLSETFFTDYLLPNPWLLLDLPLYNRLK